MFIYVYVYGGGVAGQGRYLVAGLNEGLTELHENVEFLLREFFVCF